MKQIFIALFGFFLIAASLNDARKANDAYKSGDFETAVELYRQAIESNPDDARLHFNLGSALAKLGSAEEAVQSFERAKQLMDDPRRQSMADYNAGTALSEAEMYDEALNFFRSSLRNNPEDEDAKHNYEMAIQKQQEQEQQDQ
ncbi:MAG: tetratricopeptide repeat protein, partial [Bacteroidota bacterium]